MKDNIYAFDDTCAFTVNTWSMLKSNGKSKFINGFL